MPPPAPQTRPYIWNQTKWADAACVSMCAYGSRPPSMYIHDFSSPHFSHTLYLREETTSDMLRTTQLGTHIQDSSSHTASKKEAGERDRPCIARE